MEPSWYTVVDVEDLIRSRLRSYKEETFPVAEYYRRMGQLSEIDGNRPVESVAAEILAIVRHRADPSPNTLY
jgi:adenylate kinase family enzyme